MDIITLEDGRFVFKWKVLVVWGKNFSVVPNLDFDIAWKFLYENLLNYTIGTKLEIETRFLLAFS